MYEIDLTSPQQKLQYLGLSSPENARDVIGFFHHNISQHTKEIAVINTALADLIKAKVDDEFKDTVKTFMQTSETRFERLSTSFKLLTKQVFHNDSTLQAILDRHNSNNEASVPKISIDDNSKPKPDAISELLKAQTVLQKRLDDIEIRIGSQNLQKSQNMVVFDCSPSTVTVGKSEPQKSIIQQLEEIETLKKTQQENFKQTITMFKDLSNRANESLDFYTQEVQGLYQKMEKLATKEEVRSLYKDVYSPGNRDLITNRKQRPSTATNANQNQTQVSIDQPPPVYYTMISGENLTRPSTQQMGRPVTNITRRPKVRTSHK